MFKAAAAGALLGVGGVAVIAAPAQAAPPSNCYNNSVCVYADIDFNHGDPYSAYESVIPAHQLEGCEVVFLRDGLLTSFYNNTGTAYDLWNWNGTGSRRKAGTMAPRKGYRYLNATHNDKVDLVTRAGCLDPA
ncbi:peptidase inhibitor family I36 protein [Asanoa siamensis]|uniref:Peptidase inhibitor family I36 n=1 Tax=Asanoa siamensis TaxID=926357 RepID=A0ABQ4D161_9ACTN|nr:peptidase inhibitor family I36 protein [Asanoa siamensis]GIF76988.1 hypothetical protein Asi02nite_65060 [Asanoa siamensis]